MFVIHTALAQKIRNVETRTEERSATVQMDSS